MPVYVCKLPVIICSQRQRTGVQDTFHICSSLVSQDQEQAGCYPPKIAISMSKTLAIFILKITKIVVLLVMILKKKDNVWRFFLNGKVFGYHLTFKWLYPEGQVPALTVITCL